MAFTLYQSNRQEDLFMLLAAQLDQPSPSAPLIPEHIIIPNRRIEKWLTLRLAETKNITANLAFLSPAKFSWFLARLLTPSLPEKSRYGLSVLSWRIYFLLASSRLDHTDIKQHLCYEDNVQALRLAQVLARVFERYLIYRSDWLARWEQGKLLGLGEDERWQSALWRVLVEDDPRSALSLQRLLNGLDAAIMRNKCILGLPAQLFCFNLNHLPPLYFSLLQGLGNFIDVYSFVLNPCKGDWTADRDYREQLQLAGEHDPDQLYLELGHPLLSNWAKHGRHFFMMLSEAPSIDVFAAEEELSRHTLLQNIQADILGRTILETRSSHDLDNSITIHACHTPLREVEVLYDTLLHRLQADLTLKPDEIFVLAPQIALYAPYIDAIFTAPNAVVKLPFNITDSTLGYAAAITTVFFDLLSLPTQRFEVSWVVNLISHPAVLKRFDLQPIHLDLIKDWIQLVNIDWGRDQVHKSQYHIVDEGVGSWQAGLERLLLGCILPCEMATDVPIFADRLPSPSIPIAQRDILTRFVHLIETLIDYAGRLSHSQTLSNWAVEITALLEACVAPNAEEEKILLSIQNTIAEIIEDSEIAQSTASTDRAINLSVEALTELLRQRLPILERPQGFLNNGITFCDLKHAHALPARLICILGLNYDAFPRQYSPIDVDLIHQYPRLGDNLTRLEDRYTFLEQLISARDSLYLSYIGQDPYTNQLLLPSIVIEDLLNVIDKYYPSKSAARESLVVRHALHPFDERYFNPSSPVQSFQSMWLKAAQVATPTAPLSHRFFKASLPKAPQIASVSVDTLLYFYRNPARFLLQKRLGIRLPWQKKVYTPPTILLDKKQRIQLREVIFHYREKAPQILQKNGLLRSDAFGQYCYDDEHNDIKSWLTQPYAHCPVNILPLKPISIQKWQIFSTLPAVNATYGIVLRTLHNEPSAYDRIHAWLQHLLLCIAAPPAIPQITSLISINRQYQYRSCNQDEAIDYLSWWLHYFGEGMQAPLAFFSRTSLCFAEQLFRGKSIASALCAAQQLFSPTFAGWSESQDPYLIATYPHTPLTLDQSFIEISQRLLLPLLVHQQVQ